MPPLRPLAHRGLLPVGLAVAAVLLAGCAADQGVTTLGVAPSPGTIADTPTTSTSVPTSRTTEDVVDTTTPTTTEPPPATEPPATTQPPLSEPELFVEIEFGEVVDVDDDRPRRDHDGFVAVAFTDIEQWWGEVFPDLYGTEFEPLAGGLHAGYPERRSPLPGCGEPETEYVDLTLYVAFYCELGDFIVYDDGGDPDVNLLTPLAEQYGPAVMGVVLAHEYGHTIQERIGALDEFLPTVFTEQQADCFAGAWTGRAYRGESELLRLGDADVRAGLIAMLSVRDPVGTDQFVPGGHGSAFDRVGAFQLGFSDDPGACVGLLDDPLELMPNEFQTTADLIREGNASYDCSDDPNPECQPAPAFLADDLNDFWTTARGDDFPKVTAVPVDDLDGFTCDGRIDLTDQVAFCPAGSTVVYDEPEVLELYREFGDFTLGYFYGIAWAEVAQQLAGSTRTGEDRALASDCMTGAWVGDITPDDFGQVNRPDSGVQSSPGDLDEAIRMAILIGDAGAAVDDLGSPFEKIAAFRTGVLGGLDACETTFSG